MSFVIEIKFRKLVSENYRQAVWLAKRFSKITLATGEAEDNLITLMQEEFIEKSRKVTDLWDLIGHWPGSQILIDGQPATIADLTAYSTIFGCYEKYKSAVIPEAHCHLADHREGWGCKWLTEINRYLPENPRSADKYWYQFGSFESAELWKIDKEKIKTVLQREIGVRQASLCPVFNRQKLETILDTLPDHIDLAADRRWQIVYEDTFNGATAERKPISIQLAVNRRETGSLSAERRAETEKTPGVRYIPEVSFADIGGVDEIIETIREVIELPIRKPEVLKYLGIQPHKGILLHGASGCGKTLIAKAIANEIKAHFISVRGPELLSKWHGQSEENLRRLFDEAWQLQPAIIYFDELDSIAQARSAEDNLRLDARFVNQLLTLMDGMEDYGNVRVLASTNRAELIDSALLRPGRFDYTIEIKKPTLEGCYQIFSIQTKNMPVDDQFDKRQFSQQLFGLTGAEIAFVAREGAYNCLRRNIDLGQAFTDDELDKIDYQTFIVTEADFALALSTLKRQTA